jgi:hypothetical protein
MERKDEARWAPVLAANKTLVTRVVETVGKRVKCITSSILHERIVAQDVPGIELCWFE